MLPAIAIVTTLLTIFPSANSDPAAENEEYLKFPPNFLLGASTAAYQIEGAWNISDKAESVWDRFVHDGNGHIYDNDTGDVACDSYNKFREDVALLKEIGLKAYRFSVSWPRILPTGFANSISRDGLAYYKSLVDELVNADIEPIVTLYHWDHPQSIEDAGGWLNDKIVDWFGDYARIVFAELGPKVKKFIPVNEPVVNCLNGYSSGFHAPGTTSLRGVSEYICGANALKAHARAYRIYESEFKQAQNGSIGFNLQARMYYPRPGTDARAVERSFQFMLGWMLHPIYTAEGDYPVAMKEAVAKKSAAQGYPWSRLPELGRYWIEYIRGASDFLSVNHYTSELVEEWNAAGKASFAGDMGLRTSFDPEWKDTVAAWLKVAPHGFGDLLRKLAADYGNPVMYISENGYPDTGSIEDIERIEYFQSYLKELLIAVKRDRVNVKGYLLWTLLDNFEWSRGYSERFGIVHVNFTDPERKRTMKQSAYWWQRVAHTKRWQPATFDRKDTDACHTVSAVTNQMSDGHFTENGSSSCLSTGL